ncbi:MAG: hypothetical protein ACI8Z1_003779, partial [Candidatus Azotimanducaceae bacterium]
QSESNYIFFFFLSNPAARARAKPLIAAVI